MRLATRRFVITAVAALSLAACGQAGSKTAGGLGDEMTMGNANAKVTVIEYASASCPHCARWNEEVFPAFKKKYIDTGKVKYVFREFLTPPPEVATAGFLLARCAGKDKYFAVLDAVYRSQKEWFETRDPGASLLRVAQNFGMNEQQFRACVSDEKAQLALAERVDRFQKQDSIDSTPTFIINGKKTAGEMSLPQLDAAIAAAAR
jgi:protein-disulfide isomerase